MDKSFAALHEFFTVCFEKFKKVSFASFKDKFCFPFPIKIFSKKELLHCSLIII